MKVLVTGASGQLGKELTQIFSKGKIQLIPVSRSHLDITNYSNVKSYFIENKPDWVVNCAAYTNVDKAEKDKVESTKINTLGPQVLANICELIGSKLLHISTDSVFSSDLPILFNVDDSTNPINQYSMSKSHGEQLIMKIYGASSWVIRTSWLYGEHGGKFVHNILENIKLGNNLDVVDDQFGQPTYTKNLALYIKNFILQLPNPGIYHFTDAGYASRFDLASEIAKQLKINNISIKNIKTKVNTDIAIRPKYCLLTSSNDLYKSNTEPMLWQESINIFLRNEWRA
jgi:dTDP-4-dehydrorhamnose reductase